MKLEWDITESRAIDGQWNVERVLPTGEVEVTAFTGADAEKRAREYHDWKNGLRPKAPLFVIGGTKYKHDSI